MTLTRLSTRRRNKWIEFHFKQIKELKLKLSEKKIKKCIKNKP